MTDGEPTCQLQQTLHIVKHFLSVHRTKWIIRIHIELSVITLCKLLSLTSHTRYTTVGIDFNYTNWKITDSFKRLSWLVSGSSDISRIYILLKAYMSIFYFGLNGYMNTRLTYNYPGRCSLTRYKTVYYLVACYHWRKSEVPGNQLYDPPGPW